MRNRRINKYQYFMLPPLLLVGCSANDIKPESELLEPVSFLMELGGNVTRSTIDNVWSNTTHISISNGETTHDYITSKNSGLGEGGAFVEIKPNSDVDSFFWPVSNPNWSFCGWYPAENPFNKNVNVEQNQESLTSEAYSSCDKLYCPLTPATFRENVRLKFYHQMARVIVRVNSSATEYQEKVINITIGGNRLGLTGTIENPGISGDNSPTIQWSDVSGSNSITMRKMTADDISHIYQYECILPPQSNTASDTELIKIFTSGYVEEDGNNKDFTYTYRGNFDYKAGYQYTYNLTASQRGTIIVATLKVEPWSTAPEIVGDADYPNNSYSD